MTLSEEDSRAVDLLLDRSVKADGTFAAPATNMSARVAAAEKILDLLARMPATEPPAGLAARTMQRIDEAIEAGTAHAPAQPYTAPRPLA